MSQSRYAGGVRCRAPHHARKAPSDWGLSLPGLPQASRRGLSYLRRFPAEAVEIAGITAEYNNRHFCPVCGSSLFGRSDDEIEVHAGCLDAPNQVRPTYENWVVRREDWLPPFDVARRYKRDREGAGRSEP